MQSEDFVKQLNINKNSRLNSREFYIMCAQHGQQLDGESPLWAW